MILKLYAWYISFNGSCMQIVPLFVFCNILIDFLHTHIFMFIYVKVDIVPIHKFSLLPWQNNWKLMRLENLDVSGSVCFSKDSNVYSIIFAFKTHTINGFKFIGKEEKRVNRPGIQCSSTVPSCRHEVLVRCLVPKTNKKRQHQQWQNPK